MAHLISRISLFKKFTIIAGISMLMCVFPTYLYMSGALAEVQRAQKEVQGAPLLQAVYKSVQMMQIHRGLSAGMLGGDEKLAQNRPAARDNVNQAIGQTMERFKEGQASDAMLTELKQAEQTWRQLEQAVAARQLEPAQSTARHTALIASIMQLGDDLRHAYGLQSDPSARRNAQIQASLVHAPMLGEKLGMMRALGAGFLGRKQISPEGRATLLALKQRVLELRGDTFRNFDRALRDDADARARLSAQTQAVAAQIDQALQLADQAIIQAAELTLSPSEYFATLTRTIDALNALNTEAMNLLSDELQAHARSLQMGLAYQALLLAAMAAAAIAVMVIFVRSITGPIARAVGMAQAVAHGDLSGGAIAHGDDEVGTLIAAQLQMREQLRTLVNNVRQGADSVAMASTQIAQGNQDLSARTENQASALQETAASMEQLSATVRNNADSAREANQLAAQTRDIAQQGGNAVARVVQTMHGIDEASHKIADITGLIDGIAFQTNILALNAAVEAARAGEQGRGFAVVAGEVRTLAQRSAQAAKEIKLLVETSVSRVQEGNRMAADAGTTMDNAVQAIQKLNALVQSISSASMEQATGVAQVGEAVTQMDQATQQNAALVEEMAAAATHLRAQAQDLVAAVSAFRVEAAGTPAAMATAASPRLAALR